MKLTDTGMLENWIQKYLPVPDNCARNVAVQEATAFSLQDIQGIFISLFVLLTAAFLVFLIEMNVDRLISVGGFVYKYGLHCFVNDPSKLQMCPPSSFANQ